MDRPPSPVTSAEERRFQYFPLAGPARATRSQLVRDLPAQPRLAIAAQLRYGGDMTRLLEQALETVSTLPDEVQDEVARMLLQFAGIEQPPYELTPDELADIEASFAEAERGEFATDEEVRAMWAKHGR